MNEPLLYMPVPCPGAACGAACDLSAITQRIPDKRFQFVRYYGWCSTKMRGRGDKRPAEEALATGIAVQLVGISDHDPAAYRRRNVASSPRSSGKPTSCCVLGTLRR